MYICRFSRNFACGILSKATIAVDPECKLEDERGR
jgi:hypothetical protein